MDYISEASELHRKSVPLSRLQEKEELQRLTDKFSAYVGYVRQLNQHVSNANAANFVTSTKILDEEIANLKSIYEAELQKLRYILLLLPKVFHCYYYFPCIYY